MATRVVAKRDGVIDTGRQRPQSRQQAHIYTTYMAGKMEAASIDTS